MKVIDLLNKIANGKRPEKIKYKNKIYNWSITTGNYILETDRNVSINWDFVSMFDLGNEIEIIEEDKKIEKLELYTFSSGNLEMLIELLNDLNREHVNKINEIIDYLEENK